MPCPSFFWPDLLPEQEQEIPDPNRNRPPVVINAVYVEEEKTNQRAGQHLLVAGLGAHYTKIELQY